MAKQSKRGYVQLRRGILDHLPAMSGSASKVYIALLCMADFETGRLDTSVRELAGTLELSNSTVHAALKELETPFAGRKEGYIVWDRGTAGTSKTHIRVTRWRTAAEASSTVSTDKTPEDLSTAFGRANGSVRESERKAGSAFGIPNNAQGVTCDDARLRTNPKNIEEKGDFTVDSRSRSRARGQSDLTSMAALLAKTTFSREAN